MNFLLDHNVPDSVAKVLRELDHTVTLVRDILPTDSVDPLVATAAEQMDAVLVSIDKDFRSIAPRIPKGMRSRFRKLSRLSIDCSENQAAARIRTCMPFVELAWAQAQERADKRMIAVVMAGHFRVDQ
jgi:predicted nuclease of predicted toxin-antitoxin system